MKPRHTLKATRAEGQLSPTFFGAYVRARLLDGEDTAFGEASAVFTPAMLSILSHFVSVEALATPVIFTERLSNRVLAVHITLRNASRTIAVNSRFKTDPETLAHTLIEECVHAQQVLEGVDFVAQREQFPNYLERPYERDAKRIASEVLAYMPEAYEVFLLRDEPTGVLYDRVGV